MAFANKHLIPYTIYGGVSTGDNGAVNTLSGFTNKLTEFEFILDTSDPVFNYISSDSTVWSFGDGSKSTGVSASHIYNYPGTYNITLVAYDSAGNEYLSTQVKQLSVTDFWPDRLTLGNDTITTTLNIPSNIKNAVNTPIIINRHSTHQLERYLSGSNYSLNVYASGSDSFDRSLRLKDKWVHLDTTWSFYTTTTADNGEIQLHECTNVDTTSEKLYYRYYTTFKSPAYARVPLSDLEKYPNAVFVGTSGIGSFYYGDSLPKLSREPIFVFCHLDLADIPDYRQMLQSHTYNKLHSSDLTFPSIYGTCDLVIPVRSRFRPAKKLIFTSAGLESLPIGKNKWQYIESPFFINLVDEDDNITASYSDLSGYQAVEGSAASTSTHVANISAVNTSTSSLISAHFYRNDKFGIPKHLRGMFPGFMIPYDTGDSVKLMSDCVIYTDPHYSKDTVLFAIPNRDTKEINIAITQNAYTTQEYGVTLNETVSFIRSEFTENVLTEPMLTYYHRSSSYTDDKMLGFFTGTYIESLSTYDTYSKST